MIGLPPSFVETETAEVTAERRSIINALADKIINDYLEHYSFNSDAAESHMHDCITDALSIHAKLP